MKKIRFLPIYCIVFLFTITATGQIDLSFETEVNTVCNAIGCDYCGNTMMINEVMIYPEDYDGSIYGCTQDPPPDKCRGEWIELYNPDECMWIDISCFFIGNNAMDRNDAGVIGDYPAAYIIPEGTIVPPLGFVIIRGEDAPPVPANLLVEHGGNTVEVIIDDHERVCFGNGQRFFFPNHAGWLAFYDSNGVPQDAISWNDIENGISHPPPAPPAPPCMTCHSCNPGPIGNCTFSGYLISYNEIPTDRKTYLGQVGTYVDGYVDIKGLTFRRIPDGGEWATGSVGAPTYGTCNSTCAEPYVPNCNGTATVIATGGNPPYTYIWDDMQIQTTATATNLCEGEYCVTVIDANSNVKTGCVYVENFKPEVNCPENITITQLGNIELDGAEPIGGTYSGTGVTGNYFNPETLGNDDYVITYTYTDENECYNSCEFTITVDIETEIIKETYEKFSLYPNPANNTVFIKIEKYPANLTIVDIHGRTVIKQKNFKGGEIGISEIVSGIYFVRLQSNDEVFVKKLVVE